MRWLQRATDKFLAGLILDSALDQSANQQVTAVDLPDGTTAVNGAADTAKRQPQFICPGCLSVFATIR
jgi:hypothetical protein